MSNPTSNFGWQMPTATDLVTDLPADFEVFGQAVDTSLADLKGGTTGQVLKKNTNADMDFVWAADSAGMTNPMTTTGDTIYSSSGSTPARLGIGSTGNVLTVSGGVPVWAAPAAGGKVLQVVQGTLTSSATTTSGSYVDTGLTATITPSSASSKIMVIANFQAFSINSGGSASATLAQMILLRESTQLQGDAYGTYKFAASNGPEFATRLSFEYLDSPATTSATTYKIQHRVLDCTSCGISASATKIASIVLMEIGA
jgi:hypothetical protein